MNTNPAALDQDIAALIPTTATPTEKLYGVAIDDARTMHEERKGVDTARNQSCAGVAAAQQAIAEVQKKIGDSIVFNDYDELFQACVFKGIEIRKQNMTTSTTREGVMKDVIYDGFFIGYTVYNLFAADKGFPPKPVPTWLLQQP